MVRHVQFPPPHHLYKTTEKAEINYFSSRTLSFNSLSAMMHTLLPYIKHSA